MNTDAPARRAHRRPTPASAAGALPAPWLDVDAGGHLRPVRALAVTPDGDTIVTADDHETRIGDAQTLQTRLRIVAGPPDARPAPSTTGRRRRGAERDGRRCALAIDPEGRWLFVLRTTGCPSRPALQTSASAPRTEVQAIELATGRVRAAFAWPLAVASLDLSPDGAQLAWAGLDEDGRLRLQVLDTRAVLSAGFGTAPATRAEWRPATDEPRLNGLPAVRWEPPEPVAAGAPRTARATAENAAPAPTAAPATAPRDRALVVVTGRGPGRADRGQGRCQGLRWHPRRGLTAGPAVELGIAIDPATLTVGRGVLAVATHPAAARAGGRSQVLLIRRETPGVLAIDVETPAASLALSRDGGRLLAGLRARAGAEAGERPVAALAWRIGPTTAVLNSRYTGHDHDVAAIATFGDGQALSAGGDGHAVHRWDARTRIAAQTGSLRSRATRMIGATLVARDQIAFDRLAPWQRPFDLPPRAHRFDLQALQPVAGEVHAQPDTRDRGARWQIVPGDGGPGLALRPRRARSGRSDGPDGDVLRLLLVGDDDWVLWHPQGWYAGSPAGVKLPGWQITDVQGQSAFVGVDRFKPLYRPDLLQAILQQGRLDASPGRGPQPDAPPIAGMMPPRLQWARQGVTTHDDQVVLCFETIAPQDAEPVTRLVVLRNGHMARSDTKAYPGRQRHRLSLDLHPGVNTFSVFAETARAKADPLVTRVEGPPAPPWGDASYGGPGPGRLFLLSVGVSDFAVADTPQAMGIRRLTCAHRDAVAVYNRLGKSLRSDAVDDAVPLRNAAFGEVHAKVLVNGQATKAAILDALGGFCDALQEGARDPSTGRDVLFVFLSGHGFRYVGETDLFFMNHDLVPADADATGLSMRELGGCFATVCAEVVLVVDACHAGLAGNDIVAGLDPDEMAQRVQAVAERGLYVIGAARASEKGHEDRAAGLGVFTEAMLEVLQSDRYLTPDPPAPPGSPSAGGPGGPTRSISLMELVAGLQETVPRVSARAGTPPQTPVSRFFGDLVELTLLKE